MPDARVSAVVEAYFRMYPVVNEVPFAGRRLRAVE
jgi:hypothetical protein